MADLKGLFFTEKQSIIDRPDYDGWWVMMNEPPTEDGIAQGMIIFTGLPSEESANHFIDRFNAAIEWHLKGEESS